MRLSDSLAVGASTVAGYLALGSLTGPLPWKSLVIVLAAGCALTTLIYAIYPHARGMGWFIFILQCLVILFFPVGLALMTLYAFVLFYDGSFLLGAAVSVIYAVTVWTFVIGYWRAQGQRMTSVTESESMTPPQPGEGAAVPPPDSEAPKVRQQREPGASPRVGGGD